jgi:ArsR family transcriptional regulator, arsenate/arsenite/antimonite-responsive transcriptional repressor
MDQSKALAALQALANAQRLTLVRHLMPAGDQGLPAGHIARSLGLSASGLSFHLAAMEGAGLIRSRREGRQVFYAVDRAVIGDTLGHVLNDCCMGDATVRNCCAAHRDLVIPYGPEDAAIPAAE